MAIVSMTKEWKGKVEGLCGNYDGNVKNEYMLSSGGTSTLTDYVNSYKVSPTCPDVTPDATIPTPCQVKLELIFHLYLHISG